MVLLGQGAALTILDGVAQAEDCAVAQPAEGRMIRAALRAPSRLLSTACVKGARGERAYTTEYKRGAILACSQVVHCKVAMDGRTRRKAQASEDRPHLHTASSGVFMRFIGMRSGGGTAHHVDCDHHRREDGKAHGQADGSRKVDPWMEGEGGKESYEAARKGRAGRRAMVV